MAVNSHDKVFSSKCTDIMFPKSSIAAEVNLLHAAQEDGTRWGWQGGQWRVGGEQCLALLLTSCLREHRECTLSLSAF